MAFHTSSRDALICTASTSSCRVMSMVVCGATVTRDVAVDVSAPSSGALAHAASSRERANARFMANQSSFAFAQQPEREHDAERAENESELNQRDRHRDQPHLFEVAVSSAHEPTQQRGHEQCG